MKNQDISSIQYLIPDILPLDHVSLSSKRIKFIKGQGIILYNDKYAVEMYTPRSSSDEPVFFGIQKHYGQVQSMGNYFKKIEVVHCDSPNLDPQLKKKFEEAIFHYEPIQKSEKTWIFPPKNLNHLVKETKEIYLRDSLSAA